MARGAVTASTVANGIVSGSLAVSGSRAQFLGPRRASFRGQPVVAPALALRRSRVFGGHPRDIRPKSDAPFPVFAGPCPPFKDTAEPESPRGALL
jgi:hypothetical protein